jgi:GTPase SAR1 family protein
VGKTSIITRFMYDKFDNTYQVMHSMPCLAYTLHCILDLVTPLSLALSCFGAHLNGNVWSCPLLLMFKTHPGFGSLLSSDTVH